MKRILLGDVMKRIKTVLLSTLLLVASVSAASAYLDFHGLRGYTVIHVGTITGYIDKDGERKDDFEGCDYDRKLIIDDNYTVTCTTYSYTYSYRPRAAVFSNGRSLKLVVNDTIFSVQK